MGAKTPPAIPDVSAGASALVTNPIRLQMERILSSGTFRATDAQKIFLRFVVEKALNGQAHEIKAYTVATQVFGRHPDFDQSIDPIVSIQANKLRRALEHFYLTVGKHDAIRIDIPKGTYVPTFDNLKVDGSGNRISKGDIAEDNLESSWPRVLVHSFKNLSGDPGKSHWGSGMALELATELTRYPDVRVLAAYSDAQNHPGHSHGASFEIEGSVCNDENQIKVSIQLKDTRTGVQVWSDTFCSHIDAAHLISIQEEIARIVAAKTAGEYGVISRTMLRRLKTQSPKKSKAYEAILLFYEYLLNLTPESFMRALAALSNAVEIEPECGQAWSMLGRLYANIHALDIPGYEEPLENAYAYARRGLALDPENQRSRGTLAYVYLFRDEIEAGLSEVEKAIEINPNCLFILDGLGYLMTLMGEWERGTGLIRQVIRLNPFYSTYVHYALWLDCLRKGNDKAAYLETLKLNKPSLFWDHLAQAASLGLLGRIHEGRRAAAKLKELKPDFNERGRKLIRYYIKFDDIADRVIDGLAEVGIGVK